MSTAKLIINSSLKAYSGQSSLCAGISFVHAKPAGNGGSVSIKDLIGLSTGNITTYLSGLSANAYDAIYVACPTNATNATNKIYYDAIANFDVNMKTAVRGSVQNALATGTCGTNATTTEIILGADASADDDAYNGAYIVTNLSGTKTYRYITNYVGATKTCTVATTGSAVTSTSTYIVYEQPYVYVVGDSSSNENASRVCWTTLFPDVDNVPPIVGLMGGYGSGFAPAFLYNHTATSVAAASLTETAAFTLSQFDGGTFYVAVLTATTGAGQVKRIISNTADVLTIEPWDTTPTGTVTYSIYSGDQFALYDQYLPYAVMTYLPLTAANGAIYQELLDKFNVLSKAGTNPTYNATLLKTYGDRGKSVMDCINAGYATA